MPQEVVRAGGLRGRDIASPVSLVVRRVVPLVLVLVLVVVLVVVLLLVWPPTMPRCPERVCAHPTRFRTTGGPYSPSSTRECIRPVAPRAHHASASGTPLLHSPSTAANRTRTRKECALSGLEPGCLEPGGLEPGGLEPSGLEPSGLECSHQLISLCCADNRCSETPEVSRVPLLSH